MRLLKYLAVLVLTTLYCSIVFAESPVGKWITIDDKTGQKGALIELFEKNGVLYGKINSVFSQRGDTGVCTKCSGKFKDQPIIGLPFMWGLTDRGNNVWDNGQILDARTGKIYRVKLTVKENKLYVRGYIGTSLIGRTQIWIRQTTPTHTV